MVGKHRLNRVEIAQGRIMNTKTFQEMQEEGYELIIKLLNDKIAVLESSKNEDLVLSVPTQEIILTDDEKKFCKFMGQQIQKKPKPEPEFAPGQIWITAPIDGTPKKFIPTSGLTQIFMLTVCRNESEGLTLMGVPISEEWLFASHEDMIICGGKTPLEELTMLQLWCETYLQVDLMCEYLGDIDPEVFACVQSYLSWRGGEKLSLKPIACCLRWEKGWSLYKKTLIRFEIQDNAQPEKSHIIEMGTRIIAPTIDPRAKFQKIIAKDLEYIFYANQQGLRV